MGFLSRYSAQIYALLRIVAGFMFSLHGASKLFGFPEGQPMTGVPLMLVAGIIEFGGGLLILLGLWARLAAFMASGEMAYAYFTSHAPHSFWPLVNHGELAALYCFLFLYIAAAGPGTWSLGGMMRKKG
jgi:putative oxidoreductase